MLSPLRAAIPLLLVSAFAASRAAGADAKADPAPAAAGAAPAFELPAPPSTTEGPVAPAIVDDPARTGDAPTAAAIAATLAENPGPFSKTLAEQALAESRRAYGDADVRTVIPLTNLATVKSRLGETDAALADYRRAIDIGQTAAGPRDDRLFEAWYGLGTTALAAGRGEEALDALATALQLHRVDRGLYSAPQLDVLHANALAAAAMGRGPDAAALEERRLDVAERLYGFQSPSLAPTVDSVARWRRGTGDYENALRLHEALYVLLEKTWGKDDPRLFPYLVQLARSSYAMRYAPQRLEIPMWETPQALLARAQGMAEKESFGPPTARADALLAVGDTLLLSSRRELAMETYGKAAAAFSAAGLAAPFDRPAFLSLDLPRLAGRVLQPDDGYVLAAFDVDAKGRAQSIRIAQVQPGSIPAATKDALTAALKRSQFRPRLENGQPVATQGVGFRLPVRGDSA